MIELAEGLWIDPFSVVMIKKIDENQCGLWTTGQSALEGHVLPYSAEEVVEAIEDACSDEVDEEVDPEEEEHSDE